MTDSDIVRACSKTLDLIGVRNPPHPIELSDNDKRQPGYNVARHDVKQHLCFMLSEIPSMLGKSQSKREKAMRWLGFVQGAVWLIGTCSIDDMKNINKPEADKPVCSCIHGTACAAPAGEPNEVRGSEAFDKRHGLLVK